MANEQFCIYLLFSKSINKHLTQFYCETIVQLLCRIDFFFSFLYAHKRTHETFLRSPNSVDCVFLFGECLLNAMIAIHQHFSTRLIDDTIQNDVFQVTKMRLSCVFVMIISWYNWHSIGSNIAMCDCLCKCPFLLSLSPFDAGDCFDGVQNGIKHLERDNRQKQSHLTWNERWMRAHIYSTIILFSLIVHFSIYSAAQVCDSLLFFFILFATCFMHGRTIPTDRKE